MVESNYNTADAMLESLQEIGVSYLFSNLGSDHPTIIEGLAKAKVSEQPTPEVIICPHEIVALSAAHGYAMVSGQGQGVFIHCDVGTQNLGGAIHNVSRARIPVFIFAGETPFTINGELKGTRNRHVNYWQDVYDQHGIVRQYVKWDYAIRTGKNVKELIYRAFQLAQSEPKGPVYLSGAREVLEEEFSRTEATGRPLSPTNLSVLPQDVIQEIIEDIKSAKNPLILTSYLGRNQEAVQELVDFCQALAIPVIEQNASYMNFPSDHVLHLGYQEGEFLSEADYILIFDNDIPWIPSINNPSKDCKVVHIDIDPLKEEIPLWTFSVDSSFRADSLAVLRQLNQVLNEQEINDQKISDRFRCLFEKHMEMRKVWSENEKPSENGQITAAYLSACLREVVDEDTLIIDEAITSSQFILQHLPRNKPGTYYASGASSLGWNGGAAIGAKLAQPDKMVVNLSGDGSYFFSVPSSVYWMARRYNAPIFTVIYNNQGWNATKQNLIRQHPSGIAKQTDNLWVNFDQPADLAKIAEAAGGAYAETVSDPEELIGALKRGYDAVVNGQSAVIDVRLPAISNQK